MAEPTAEEAKKEAERQAIEQLKSAIQARLDGMRALQPAAAEETHKWIKEQCADTRLPAEFKREAGKTARTFECEANMRATDAALAEAARLAAQERMGERAAKLSEARKFHTKACGLGANDHFRKATGRLIETIMLTGGVFKPGQPTKAKPLDTAPKPPNLAKPDPVPAPAPAKVA